jgi:hypothetical protein
MKNLNEIQHEFLQDVFTDFNENHGNLLGDLASEEQDWLTERIKSEIQKIIALQ